MSYSTDSTVMVIIIIIAVLWKMARNRRTFPLKSDGMWCAGAPRSWPTILFVRAHENLPKQRSTTGRRYHALRACMTRITAPYPSMTLTDLETNSRAPLSSRIAYLGGNSIVTPLPAMLDWPAAIKISMLSLVIQSGYPSTSHARDAPFRSRSTQAAVVILCELC